MEFESGQVLFWLGNRFLSVSEHCFNFRNCLVSVFQQKWNRNPTDMWKDINTGIGRLLLFCISTVSLKLEIFQWIDWMAKSLLLGGMFFFIFIFCLFETKWLQKIKTFDPTSSILWWLMFFVLRRWLFLQLPPNHSSYKDYLKKKNQKKTYLQIH